MYPKRPFSVIGALAIGLVTAVITMLFPSEQIAQLPPMSIFVWIMAIWTIFAVPFAYWFPVARARFFFSRFPLPYNTYVVSRPLLCLFTTMMVGTVVAHAVLGVALDFRFAICATSELVTAAVMVFSASRRFSRSPSSEFVMPFFRLRYWAKLSSRESHRRQIFP